MFSTDFIFRQQENLVDNQKCQSGFRPLCNKILFFIENKNAIKLEFFPGRCHSRVFIKAFMVSPVGVETHKRLQNQAQVQFISVSVIPDKLTKFDQIYRTIIMS